MTYIIGVKTLLTQKTNEH